MTEKEWEVVVKNNVLTHAYRIDKSAHSAVVARRPRMLHWGDVESLCKGPKLTFRRMLVFKLKRRPAEIFVVDDV